MTKNNKTAIEVTPFLPSNYLKIIALVISLTFLAGAVLSINNSNNKSVLEEKSEILKIQLEKNVENINTILNGLILNTTINNLFSYDYQTNNYIEAQDYYLTNSKIVFEMINQSKLSIIEFFPKIIIYHDTSIFPNADYWLPISEFEKYFFSGQSASMISSMLSCYELNEKLYFVKKYSQLDRYLILECNTATLFDYLVRLSFENEKICVKLNDVDIFQSGDLNSILNYNAEVSAAFFNISITTEYSFVNLLIIAAIVILFFITAVLIITGRKKIIKYRLSIENILKNVNDIAKGNFDIYIDIDTSVNEEIANLAGCINSMAKEVKSLIEGNFLKTIELKNSEFELLQNQIKPHFLYNILSMLNWKALEAKNENLSKSIMTLARYYQTSLSSGRNIISFREEIENVKCYLYLQSQIKVVNFNYKIDDGNLNFNIPKQTLQPLVENCLEHGYTKNREFLIEIIARVINKDIMISIKDNGLGMPLSKLEKLNRKEEFGVGLRNVLQRLESFFEEKVDLNIESIREEGTCVKLIIHNAKEKYENNSGF